MSLVVNQSKSCLPSSIVVSTNSLFSLPEIGGLVCLAYSVIRKPLLSHRRAFKIVMLLMLEFYNIPEKLSLRKNKCSELIDQILYEYAGCVPIPKIKDLIILIPLKYLPLRDVMPLFMELNIFIVMLSSWCCFLRLFRAPLTLFELKALPCSNDKQAIHFEP